MDGFYTKPSIPPINLAKYFVSGTEEEIVKKEIRNLLVIFAKHREGKTGVDMVVEYKRLIKKYNV